MKAIDRKKLLTICTMATFTFASVGAMASSDSICSNPLQRICEDTKIQRKEREVYVSKLKKEISDEASRNATPRINEMKRKIPSYRFLKRFFESLKIKNQETMASAKKRIGGIEEVITNPENVSKIKNYMYQAIDSSAFNNEAKENFKGIVKTIVVGNFADFLQKSNLENSVFAQILGNACGSDGLVDNAFATDLKGERYVLICPGFLITLSQTASAADRFNSILQAISHEMGHHIDNSKVGNDLYAPYLSCLAKNYITRFNKTKDDEKFCKTNINEPKKCNEKVVISHAGELVADQWGILTTAIHAKSESYSFSEAEQMLTDSWVKLCGSGDEGVHPTGDFRIGTLMRKNPSINEYLSCSPSDVDLTPSCTFAGERNL